MMMINISLSCGRMRRLEQIPTPKLWEQEHNALLVQLTAVLMMMDHYQHLILEDEEAGTEPHSQTLGEQIHTPKLWEQEQNALLVQLTAVMMMMDHYQPLLLEDVEAGTEPHSQTLGRGANCSVGSINIYLDDDDQYQPLLWEDEEAGADSHSKTLGTGAQCSVGCSDAEFGRNKFILIILFS
jgi:hypothetical protein